MAEYKSKTVLVQASPVVLFNRITDLQGMMASVPEDKRKDITVDGDTIRTTQSGFTIAICIREKVPFSKVVFADVEAPFHFSVTVNLEGTDDILQTRLSVDIDADLNFMMKAVLGGKIQEYLDKAVDMFANGAVTR